MSARALVAILGAITTVLAVVSLVLALMHGRWVDVVFALIALALMTRLALLALRHRTEPQSAVPLRRVMPTGMTEQDREWLHRHYDICGAIMERRPPPYIELPPGKMTYMEWRHAYYDVARRRNELAEKVRQAL